MAPDSKREPREPSEVRTNRIVAFALGFVGFAVALGGGLAVYYRSITSGERLTISLQLFPAPQLQPNPTRDWNDVHRAQVEALEGYRWVDRDKGMVHVPIAQAMARVAARGPAAYEPVAGTPPFVSAGGAPIDGAPRAQPQRSVAPYGNIQ